MIVPSGSVQSRFVPSKASPSGSFCRLARMTGVEPSISATSSVTPGSVPTPARLLYTILPREQTFYRSTILDLGTSIIRQFRLGTGSDVGLCWGRYPWTVLTGAQRVRHPTLFSRTAPESARDIGPWDARVSGCVAPESGGMIRISIVL